MDQQRNVSRRNFSALITAALGGAVAGVSPAAFAAKVEGDKVKVFVDPALMLSGEANVCRGLNQCKGKGKGDHECAGLAACASAEAHVCKGHNACKAQGGCGGYPGQNTCKEKGHCAVPLEDKTWALARKQFEQLMKDAGRKFGNAPKKA